MEIKIVSDGTKEGTKVLIDGMEMTTTHWKCLTWEFDFLMEAWTVKIDHLPLAQWISPIPSVASVDISMEVDDP